MPHHSKMYHTVTTSINLNHYTTPPEQHKACWDMINDNYLVIDHALAIPSPAALGEVVDCGELNQGGEDKGVTHCDEPVHGCGIGDFRQGVTGADTQSGHSQYSGHT